MVIMPTGADWGMTSLVVVEFDDAFVLLADGAGVGCCACGDILRGGGGLKGLTKCASTTVETATTKCETAYVTIFYL